MELLLAISLFGGRLATLRTLDDMIFVNGYRVTRHGKLNHFIPPRFTKRDCGSAKMLNVNKCSAFVFFELEPLQC